MSWHKESCQTLVSQQMTEISTFSSSIVAVAFLQDSGLLDQQQPLPVVGLYFPSQNGIVLQHSIFSMHIWNDHSNAIQSYHLSLHSPEGEHNFAVTETKMDVKILDYLSQSSNRQLSEGTSTDLNEDITFGQSVAAQLKWTKSKCLC